MTVLSRHEVANVFGSFGMKTRFTNALFVPIPGLDGHVVATSESDAEGRMDGQAADLVRMSFENGDLLVCVVEHAKLEVVGPGHEHILARNDADASYGNLGNFE